MKEKKHYCTPQFTCYDFIEEDSIIETSSSTAEATGVGFGTFDDEPGNNGSKKIINFNDNLFE